MNKKFLEFFAGIGLVRVGLEKEGWNCIFANDISPQKTRIYERNFGTNQMIEGDVKSLNPKKLPCATLATACFPCQDLSEAGSSEGIHGPCSCVFWQFTSILRDMGNRRPPIVLLENVRGFLTAKEGSNLLLAIKELNNLGYLCDALLINGKHFLPQSRPRVFVIGVLENQLKPSKTIEYSLFKEHPFRPKQILCLMRNHPDLKWINLRIPTVLENGTKLEAILDPIEEVPHEYWFCDEAINKHMRMMPAVHKAEIDRLRLHKKNGVFTMYRRMRKGEQKAELRLDGIAGCLRSARGGSSKQFLVLVDKGELKIRKLTVSELRRLMAVPNGYYLPDDYNEVYSVLGEAVIVPVIEWIAKNVLNPLCDSIWECPKTEKSI